MAPADRDLAECRQDGLSPDWCLAIAYNAALQCATAALAAAGYRAGREGHHYRVIASLRHTVGSPAHRVETLNRFRRQRHTAAYERAGAVSEQDAEGMLQLALALRADVQAWLEREHPDLLAATG